MTSKIILIHALSPMKTTDTENFKQKNSLIGLRKLCYCCLPNVSFYQKVGSAYSDQALEMGVSTGNFLKWEVISVC